MKTLFKVSCLSLFLLTLSCKKDDNEVTVVPEAVVEPETPEEENNAPLNFELVVVPDDAEDIDVLPIFSWNASTDPDGDTVVYDLYLDQGAEAEELYAENITLNSYEVSKRLELIENYSWKVVAKDPEGATVSSSQRSFTTRDLRFNDTPETANAAFGERQLHSSVVFEDRIWVIGGSIIGAGTIPFKDVWLSEDGENWELVTESADFGTRTAHSSVVFDNKMWVIGGSDGTGGIKSDVWFSEDGRTWKELLEEAPFKGRVGHTSVVYDNKIWVIGGADAENKLRNDVWYSEDGFTWNESTKAAQFEARNFHSTLVFDGAMYVVGGRNKIDTRMNDVWVSTDGSTWDAVTIDASFTGRFSHSTLVFDNKMWVIAGLDEEFNWNNDAWFSTDGETWTEAISAAPFSRRFRHSTVVFDNKAWVIAGTGEANNVQNDVWTFE